MKKYYIMFNIMCSEKTRKYMKPHNEEILYIIWLNASKKTQEILLYFIYDFDIILPHKTWYQNQIY